MKRWLAICLTLALCLSMVPTALAAGNELLVELPSDGVENYQWDLIPVYTQEKAYGPKRYGYADKTGKIIVPLEYDMAYPMSEGLGLVSEYKDDGKSIFVDATGKAVMEFDGASPFSEGLARVRVDGKSCFIDKTGKTVITDDNYSLYTGFSGGTAVVIDRDSGKQGLIDKTGKVILPMEYNVIENPDERGYRKVSKSVGYDIDYGAVDAAGKIVVPVIYDGIEALDGGLAWVKKDGKNCYVSLADGQEYEKKGTAHNGLQEVQSGDKAGFVDDTGKLVVPMIYRKLNTAPYSEDEGLWRVTQQTGNDSRYGMMDKTGKLVIPLDYTMMDYSFSEGLIWAKKGRGKDSKYGYLDATGKEAIPFTLEYNLNTGVGAFHSGRAYVKTTDNKYGYIDKTGKVVIAPEYDYAYDFHGALAGVGKKNAEGKTLYGFIDTTGKVVVQPEYDSCYMLHDTEDLHTVKKGNKTGVIDATGKLIVPTEYERVNAWKNGLLYADNYDSSTAVVYDQTGKVIIPAGTYSGISEMGDLIRVTKEVKEGTETIYHSGLLDKTGKVVLPVSKVSLYETDEKDYIKVYDSVNGNYYLDTTGKKADKLVQLPGGGTLVATGEGYPEVYAIYGATAPAPTANIAHPSTQTVDVDGKKVEFQCYALKDAAGNDTNYIKLRDLADILNGSAAQFQVGWDGNITITTGAAYTKNGTEQNTPFSGQWAYEKTAVKTLVDGKEAMLDTFQLKDDNGGGYTYYKLRDLGTALGITVDWSAERGIFIETK